jgi:hypothetical protein
MPVKRYNGTSWDVIAGDGAQGPSGTSALTTKGDILTFDTAPNRLAVGTDGQALVADSTQAKGIAWAAPNGLSFISTTAFSGVASVSINNCFSATYNNYLITITTTSSGNTPTMKLRVSGTDSSASYYDGKISSVSTTGTTLAATVQANVTTGWKIGNSAGQLSGSLDILVKSPFLANTTAYNTTANYGSNMGPQSGIEINAGYHAAGTSYDGFTLTFTSNAIGTVRVYGLRN